MTDQVQNPHAPSVQSAARGPWGTRRGFTLVELLVVIGVIAVAAAVALPSIGSLSKSSSRNTAVSLTLSALDQARGLALAQSTNHYLVLADGNAAWPEAYRFRAFAVFQEVYYPAQQTYLPAQVTKWTLLPSGVAFNPSELTVFQAPKMKFYCQPAGQELDVAFFRFNSIGSVEEPIDAKLARLTIFEGFIDSAGTVVPTNKAGTAGEENILVSLVTGRAKRETTDAG